VGNFIGTDVTGAAPLGNNGEGVLIIGAPGNTIGGTASGARNVISGNGVGVWIDSDGASGNQVLGNFIGTDVTGTAGLGNYGQGVWIYHASNNMIGGTAAGAGNVISGNGAQGVEINGILATGNQILGNLIGTQSDGLSPLGNRLSGVIIANSASSNSVGGTASGAGNAIANNTGAGVWVTGTFTARNTIRGNSVHSNGSKGIANVNGGNTELAPPIIDSVGGSVSGHTNPKCYPCTVEVFSDSEDEGRIYHGSPATNDDATGTWLYPGGVTGPNVTATITDAYGNTSEFSVPVAYFPAVGGIAELPDVAQGSPNRADLPKDSSPSASRYVPLAGLAAALAALIAGAWYARRRWLR
jgi:titin